MTTDTIKRSPVWEEAGAPWLAGVAYGPLACHANPNMTFLAPRDGKTPHEKEDPWSI